MKLRLLLAATASFGGATFGAAGLGAAFFFALTGFVSLGPKRSGCRSKLCISVLIQLMMKVS